MRAPSLDPGPTHRSTHRAAVVHGAVRSVAWCVVCAGLAASAALAPRGVGAQQLDSVRSGVQRPVSEVRAAVEPPARRRRASVPDSLGPPITPRRAFLYSLLVPGAGQAKLDRGYAGGMFFLIEVSALVLVHRSAEDYRIARRFAGDSIPLRFTVNGSTGLPVLGTNGTPQVDAWSVPRYDEAYVRTRRLHYEDWLAVMIFNHLFAGADAFVAAQLWDLPAKVSVRRSPVGTLVQATVAFR